MPLVSIIVPIYKVEKYLRECIDSILCQTFSDFELILVDDGSPDACGVICEEYAEQDSRICVIHKTNGGLSDARNAGLDIARGKYVYFVDSDDAVEPELLETLVPHMENGYGMATFTFRRFYDDGTKLEPLKREAEIFFLNSPEERKTFLYGILFSTSIGWEAWSRMFVREIIEAHHIRFADNRKIFAEDMYFSLCYCAHISRVISLDVCLYNYRQRQDSIMGQQTGRNNIPRILELTAEVKKHYAYCNDCRDLLEDFSLLQFQVLMSQFASQIQYASDHTAFRELVRSSLPNWREVESLLRQNLQNRSVLRKYYSPLRYLEIVQSARFLLGGSAKIEAFSIWMIQRIRNQGERIEQVRAVWKGRSSQREME